MRPEDPEEYPGYECFGYERMMPKLNLANPETAEYFCKVGRYWVEKFHIDGWRLDVASEINDGFWRKFRESVKAWIPTPFSSEKYGRVRRTGWTEPCLILR